LITAATTAEHENRASLPPYRWKIAWLLGLGVLVNYFDRVNLSVSHEALITTFGISNIAFGYLSGAYNWTYALCQLPVGVLLDRFGVKRVGRISTFLWSVASFGAAGTPNLGGFFAARLLLGVGEAPTFPANAKAVGQWFPTRERSLATSIFDSAAKFSSAIGVPLIGLMLLSLGWRLSFAVTGLISFLYFLLFRWIYRDPEDVQDTGILTSATPVENDFSAETELRMSTEPSSSLGYLVRQKKVLGLALGFGSYNYIFYLLLTWLPSYLSSALHINLRDSFLYTGVPWLSATVVELIVGGWLVDFLVQRGWNSSRVRKVVLVGGTAFGLGILGAAHAHSAGQALFWISVSISGLSAASPVGWSIPSLIAPRGCVGKVGGIMNFSNQLSGIAAPIVTGYVVAATRSFAWAFGVSAAYLLVGIAGYIFLLGRIEQVPAQTHTAG